MYDFLFFAAQGEVDENLARLLGALFAGIAGFLLVWSCSELNRLPRKRRFLPSELLDGFDNPKYQGLSAKHIEYLIIRWDLSDSKKDALMSDPSFRNKTESELTWLCLWTKAQLDSFLRDRTANWQFILMGAGLCYCSAIVLRDSGGIGFLIFAIGFAIGALLASAVIVLSIKHRRVKEAVSLEPPENAQHDEQDPPVRFDEYA